MRTLNRPRVLVWAPTLYESGFKQHHVDGEALALQASLERAGYDSTLLDAYYRGRPAKTLHTALTEPAAGIDIVVAHLFTTDAYGTRLHAIADELRAARIEHGVRVVGFGPLAVSAAAELHAHGAVDHVAGTGERAEDDQLAPLLAHLDQHLREHTPLTDLRTADLPYSAGAVVSVAGSRGCRSRCTFCAYNADLPGGGWYELPMDAVLADIACLHHTIGATQFAFTDSDFGGTPDRCHERAVALRDGIRALGLAGIITFAISVRPETLTPDTIRVLADAGVRTALVGIESLNPNTLHRLYGKRQDLTHLNKVVVAADTAGIVIVGSYILWHPWQTLTALRAEVEAIDAFGRFRIPQFMARSVLRVVPGTVIERQVRAAGLLDEAPFHREFRMAHPAVHALYADLQAWFTENAQPVIAGLHEDQHDAFRQLSVLKAEEWCWFTQQVTDRCEEPARA
ncbi:radical SAM protein [Actinoplanes sp. NPDC026623]|uniref:B12-binding domain-containing radical SAM protein n=1 Tax=Actinoplanes sp. NPDC026623 TaxID=3155610 RepID=UPI0033F9DC0A